MPNRIIKESAFTSDKISNLSDFEFRLWIGLITQADDAGRGDARPAILKGRIFALRDRVTAKDIDAALHGLAAHGCVSLYTVGGKPYYEFPTWAAHQRIRDCKARYPGKQDADNCNQVITSCGDSPQVAADCGLNPIQSNPNLNPNTNSSAAKPRTTRFVPPTLDEVSAYCRERGSNVDAEHFLDFYSSKGWKVGSQPMKDWKACVRTWEKNGFSRGQTAIGTSKMASTSGSRKMDDDERKAILAMMEDE